MDDAVSQAGERRFRTALSSMVDPVSVISAVTSPTARGRKRGEVIDFVVSYANDRSGTPRVGTMLSSLWSASGYQLLLENLRRLLDGGEDLAVDALHLPGTDGSDRYFDIRAARLDENEVIATWRDVTDRVKAEEALADSEALLRGAFDDAPVGALLIGLDGSGEDEGGQLLKVNRTFATLVGYRRQELLGMPFSRLLHPDDMAAGATPKELLERIGEPVRLRKADGSSVWVRLSSGQVSLGDHPAYLVIHAEDVTSRRQIEQELADRHLHDPLTGLANRHLLLDRFRLAVDNLDRHPGAIVVLHIDLDRFKDVNDTYGHSVGDHVLAEVGRRLDGLVDSPDTAARLAGDEFVIVTAARRRGTAAVTGAATRLAEEVSEVLGEVIRLPENDDVTLQLSVSIGITVTTSPESEPEQLLLQADRAMFEAKRRGRRRYELFRQGLSSTAPERLKVEQEVRDAVANGWLRLYYQPVIDLTTGRLGGAEALLRIEHPERGLLKPGAFIDIVEDSDLILPIGDWVLGEACRQLQQWQEIPGLADFSMAVNVSGRQASDSALTGRALAAVAAAGVDPKRLCLEMTERVLIDADESVVSDLRSLTAQGVQIALDDFGTGYASLSYLQRFPVSTLKIDRSFVTGVGVTTTDTAIVASIVALAKALNLDVVAEGVETAEQLAHLRSHHCAKAQGFFFAPPLEAEIFAKALEEQREHDGK
ncbi:MAG TPA: EAL domain-containing protein [Frankiaceae bacterium]|nr:EAL domain-containing protein [Frankiaceae bacterium]